MNRNSFFKKKFEFLTLRQVLDITDSTLYNSDNNLSLLEEKIYDIATLENATFNQISFLNSGRYSEKFRVSKAGFCLIEEQYATKAPAGTILLSNKNPYYAYAKLAASFYKEFDAEIITSKNQKIYPENNLAIIHETVVIGKNARICAGVVIGKNVKIGDDVYIGPNSVIMDNCVIGNNVAINSLVVISFAFIGNNCIIHNGAKIGQDGFGFAHNLGINHKILQLGIVVIGNDVEIGASSCIDRGAIEDTIISDGVKIDNLVQIAHNVVVGKGTVIAGCSAIAGSTKIGNFVQIGGSSAVAGHITIGDGAKIAGGSGLIRDVLPMQVVGGIPALPFRDWQRLNSKLAALAKLHGDKINN
jgi:UDP-3-O-[3-hydroxymyristoyl] glucosamine N-acyltransferase